MIVNDSATYPFLFIQETKKNVDYCVWYCDLEMQCKQHTWKCINILIPLFVLYNFNFFCCDLEFIGRLWSGFFVQFMIKVLQNTTLEFLIRLGIELWLCQTSDKLRDLYTCQDFVESGLCKPEIMLPNPPILNSEAFTLLSYVIDTQEALEKSLVPNSFPLLRHGTSDISTTFDSFLIPHTWSLQPINYI